MALLALGAALLPAGGSAASFGQLYGFGDNRYGQLGNTTNDETSKPNPTPILVTLPGEVGPITQAATGISSLALTATGQLYGFGDNRYGQLGNETNNLEHVPNPTPTLVTLPGASGPVTHVAGGGHTLAVTSTGQLYAFGNNEDGQLGNETNNGMYAYEANPTPTLVTLPGEVGPVTQAAAGGAFSLAVTESGQLYAFGENFWGQLGNTTNDETSKPNPTPMLVTLPGEVGPVTQAAAGGAFSLAVTESGQLYAFGENINGELGNPTNNLAKELKPNPTPTLVTLPGEVGSVAQIAAGDLHTLVLTSGDQLYAFGFNQCGELGNTTNNRTWAANPTPTLVTLPGASGRIRRIAAGDEYSLVLTSTGQLYAFGCDAFGELGSPPGKELLEARPTPQPVAMPGGARVETMASGSDDTLVVLDDLSVANSSLPADELGLPYSAQAQRTGGAAPYTWSAAGLPPGLSINRTSGAISGTPTTPGTYTATITPTDSAGIEAPTPLTITINTPPSVRNETLPGGEVGLPYNALARGIGGGTPYTWAASGLPPGLSINRTSGAISGIPTATGSYTPTITLTDSYGIEASMPLTIAITTPSPVPNETLPPVSGKTMLPSLPPKTPSAPSVRNARQSVMRWREGNQLAHISRGKTPTGTTFSFSLNEQATVSFSFTQIHGELQSGHSCVATIPKNARRKQEVRRESCSAVTAATLSFSGHSATNNVLFAGWISRTSKLKPGRYKLIIIAANSTGQRSTPVSLIFTIVK